MTDTNDNSTNSASHFRPMISAKVLREEVFKHSDMTQQRWIKNGVLPPPIKLGGTNYFYVDEVQDCIDAARSAPDGGEVAA